ncbi:hypothetical protein [Paracoccus salsus]|uniref:hypothetical protein n=1 Tax=Paracoccus salsus TaxID=2911061 RepID=UPI001F1A2AC5|nr:hypothetical protein [Paracoccus salsus]MCF3972207.1 hypothetical protein [Paracoccus salsus]
MKQETNEANSMRFIKLLVVLILAGAIGIVAYAYLGDMDPVRQEVRSPVALGGSGD